MIGKKTKTLQKEKDRHLLSKSESTARKKKQAMFRATSLAVTSSSAKLEFITKFCHKN